MSFVLLLIILSASEAILQVPTIAPTPPRLTTTANSDYMFESRYNFLLDLILHERQSRNNLEKELLELRTRIQTAEQESSNMKRNLTFELNLTTANCIGSLNAATKRYDFLIKDHESLKMDYDTVFNETIKLEEQLRILDVSRITSIFNNFSAIENKLYALEKNIAGADKSINIIMSERKARQQDFLALINITRQTSQRLANNEHVMTTQFGQLRTSQQSIEQDMAAFHIDTQKNVSELEMHFANRMDILEKITNSISSKMQLSLADLSKSSEKVAVTACAIFPHSVVNTNEVVKFMNVKFSYGIQSISTFMRSSVFTCEKPGLYMVSVDIVSNTYDAFLVIVKNDVILSGAYVSFEKNHLWYSGSATTALMLNSGDRVFIRSMRDGVTINDYSCFTIMKIN